MNLGKSHSLFLVTTSVHLQLHSNIDFIMDVLMVMAASVSHVVQRDRSFWISGYELKTMIGVLFD